MTNVLCSLTTRRSIYATIWLAAAFVLVFFLPVEASAQPTLASVTKSADTIGRYERLEITVGLSARFSNPYDSRQVELVATLTAPDGATIIAPGFHYQDYAVDNATGQVSPRGNPVWKIRLTPGTVGIWSFVVRCTDADGSVSSSAQTFTCTASTSRGFVRTVDGRELRFDDGTKYFAVGENMGWGGSRPLADFRNWIDRLSASGGNYVRIWMASWSFAVEWQDTGLGDYTRRQQQAFLLDQVIDYAASKGVFVQLCLHNHGQVSANVNPEWAQSPYNAANGGPCAVPHEFFTNATARDLVKRRLRYVVSRWSYATNLLAWELFNEVNLSDRYEDGREGNIAWHKEMASHLKALDPNDHLVTTSYNDTRLEPDVWRHSDVDFTQSHMYLVTSDAQSVHRETVGEYLSAYGKPTLIGEYGFPDSAFSNDNDPTGIDFHNSLWASSVSGSFGTAMTWWWDNYIDPRNLYGHFKAVSAFAAGTSLVGSVPVEPACDSGARSDLAVTPGFTAFDRAPSNRFEVASGGAVSPSATNLGRYLFAARYHPELVNPPTFVVQYARNGAFQVVTGPATGKAPTIQIWLDGRKVLDRSAAVNRTYTIQVPAGAHEIFVDNQGTDWIEISDFVFESYVPAIRSFALRSDEGVAGWLHNRAYNWQSVKKRGKPAPVTDGTVGLTGLRDGLYAVQWRSCQHASLARAEAVTVSNGAATLSAPTVAWDVAYRLRFLEPGSDTQPPSVSAIALSKRKVKRSVDPTVQITWTEADDVASFEVQFAADGSDFATVVADVAGSATSVVWTVAASVPKTKVGAVRLVAYDAAGNAAFSAPVGLVVK
jgi:hypothetical protein